MDKRFDRKTSHLSHHGRCENTEEKSKRNQRLADLQHKARPPRLATETNATPDTKTCNGTEDAAADRAKNEDSSSARVDDGPTNLTSFGMTTEPLLVAPEKGIGDNLDNKSAEAPKPHLPLMEVYMLPSTAGGLLPAGTASAAMGNIFFPTPLPESFCLAKMRTSRKTFSQLAPPCWRKVIVTKPRQTLAFDPGGCTSRLRDHSILGGRHALLRWEGLFGCCDSIRGWSAFGSRRT